MARGRMIANAITNDKRIAALSSDTCRLAFTWLLTLTDGKGRIYGDPAIVRSLLFPRREDVIPAQVAGFIQEWVRLGLVELYDELGDARLKVRHIQQWSYPGRPKTLAMQWRNAVLERDGYRCQLCGETDGKLEAHHIAPYYLAPEQAYDMCNGTTLCHKCHREQMHGKGWKKELR